MGGTGDSGAGRARVDAAAKAAFLAVMEAGGRLDCAAAAFGVTLQAFRAARRRDPAFDREWREAHARSAAAERRRRRGRAADRGGEVRIAPNNRRRLQQRRMRHVRFDEERRGIFLAHFALACDAGAAAAEAGVCERTVFNHRRADPAFAAEFETAMEQGYVRLEAESLRQRLAAQQRLREAIEGAEGRKPAAAAELVPEAAAEFERVLKLLARRDRKPRRPEGASGGRPRTWTFEGAIALLDQRLAALDIPVPALPAEVAARYDGEEGTVTSDCPQ